MPLLALASSPATADARTTPLASFPPTAETTQLANFSASQTDVQSDARSDAESDAESKEQRGEPWVVSFSPEDHRLMASFSTDDLQCLGSEMLVSRSESKTASTTDDSPTAPFCSPSAMLTDPACAYPAAPHLPLNSRAFKDKRSPSSIFDLADHETPPFIAVRPNGALKRPHELHLQPPVPPPRAG